MADEIGIKLRLDGKQVKKESSEISKKLKKEFSGIDETIVKSNNSIKSFTSSIGLASIGIASVSYAVIKLSSSLSDLKDEYTLLRSQVKLVIDDEKNLRNTQLDLLEVANKSRQSISATTQLYTRLDRSTKQLALSDKEVIGLTETLNKAIIISGASANESSAAIIQLSQGLASGALRGDELRSVLEQVPRVAQLIADGLGVSVGQLRTLGTEGELTTEKIVNAVKTQAKTIEEEYKKTEKTTSQVWTVLTNNAGDYIDQIGLVTSAQKAFNSLLEDTSKTFEKLNKKNQLEIAKTTSILERSSNQQKLIIEEQERLSLQKDKAIENSGTRITTKRLIEEKGIIQSAIRNSKSQLILIEEREAKEAKELSLLKEKAKIEAEQAEKARVKKELEKKAAEQRAKDLEKFKQELNEFNNQQNEIKIVSRQEQSSGVEGDIYLKEAENAKALNEFKKSLLSDYESIDSSFYDLKIKRINEERDNQLRVADELLISEQQYKDLSDQIYINSAKKKRKIEEEQLKASISQNMEATSSLSGALRGAFSEYKEFAIADIIIKGAQGLATAFTLPPPASYIQAAAVSVNTISSLATVSKTGYANGTEFVQGAGGPRTDSIDTRLSVGERVINANDNARLNGVTNEELVNGNRNDFSTLGLINALFSPEEIAQKIRDYQGLADIRGFVAQG